LAISWIRKKLIQGTLFLDAFLERLGLNESSAKNPNARVTLERILAGGQRIDLLLEVDNYRIGIENKPWATYQGNQLADYPHEIENLPGNGNWTLVCLANSDPTEFAINPQDRNDRERAGQFVSASSVL